MSTIVFVMMVYSQGAHVMPALEFSTLAKCEAAALAMVTDYNKKFENNFVVSKWTNRFPYCVKIEK